MHDEPAVAVQILDAFERTASEPDPIFPFSEGFALAYRHFDQGLLTQHTRLTITEALWRAERAALTQIPEQFGAERLRMGVETLGALLNRWAEPLGSPEREHADVRLQRFIMRTVANDLDSICARIEIERDATFGGELVQSTPRASSMVVH